MIRIRKLTVVNAACLVALLLSFGVCQRSGRSGRCEQRLHSTPLVVEVSECFSARLCARHSRLHEKRYRRAECGCQQRTRPAKRNIDCHRP